MVTSKIRTKGIKMICNILRCSLSLSSEIGKTSATGKLSTTSKKEQLIQLQFNIPGNISQQKSLKENYRIARPSYLLDKTSIDGVEFAKFFSAACR